MNSFMAGGKTWTFELNVDSIEQVRARLNIDLYELQDAIMEISAKPKKMVDVLYVLCAEQADELFKSAAEQKKTTPDRLFGQQFRGAEVDAATKAFLEEIGNFFQQQAPMIRSLLDKSEKVKALAIARASEIVETLKPETILEQLRKESEEPSGNAPESAASIPVDSRSGN